MSGGVAARPERDLVSFAESRLAAAGVASPVADARWLMAAASEGGVLQRSRFDEMLRLRCDRVPLQLVIGSTTFRWISLACRPGVFIPRPETEVVAGAAIDAALAVVGRRPRVVEVGTGSGAIALSIASEVPTVEVMANDIDAVAVAAARANLDALVQRTRDHAAEPWRPGDHLAPEATMEVAQGSLLEAFYPSWRNTVDVLVSNPPYLKVSDRGSWQPEVADHDPDHALVAGEDGHEVVDSLLAVARDWLRPGGSVVVEIDDRRGHDALATAAAAGLVEGRLITDLTGRDRAVVAQR